MEEFLVNRENTHRRPKILYFTFLEPTEKHGGGIAILQSLNALCSFADIEYIGPKYNKEELDLYDIRPISSHIIYENQSKITTALHTATKAITTKSYNSWKATVDKIDTTQYDCCFMDFAKQDFVVKWAHKQKLPIVVRAHNVESDYYKFYDAMRNQKKSLFGYIFRMYKTRAEKYCIQKADKILAITNNDKNRLIELYGNHADIDLLPVCVRHFDKTKVEKLPEPFIAITGQLSLGSNSEGTIWFLKNVWSNLMEDITDKYSLVIAGAKPNEEIKNLSKEMKNVHLYDTPDYIDAFYQQAIAYVAPIFYGAGMKVKIAEALSCGLPVITTEHAFAGYEPVETLVSVCENKEEFVAKLNCILTMSVEESADLRKRILEAFEDHYSLKYSSKTMESIITDIIHRKK